MPRNGSGTYNLVAGNPVVTGTTISSTTTNNTFNDIATALTGSISKDGQTTPTGNLPMGGYAHTGVADATVRTQYGTAGQIQDSAFTYLTSPAGTNAMTATAALGMSAYVTGQRFFFVAPATNTGACTLNINAIGVKSVTKQGATALVAGDIVSGAVVQVVYDGTQFQLLNPAAVNSFSAGSTGLTPSTATTGAVTLAGTLAVANGGTGQTSSTGSGAVVLATSPTLVTPALGTPSALVGTNITGTSNALNAGIGVNQTWTNVLVTPGRALGTPYTNNTGKPIQISVTASDSTVNNSMTVVVNSVTVFQQLATAGYSMAACNLIIPAGATYTVSLTSGTIIIWAELR